MVSKRKAPGAFASLIVGTSGILLGGSVGVLIAAIYLVFKPVEEVKQLPKPEEREAVVYYVEGRRSGMDGAAWVGKRNQLISGAPFEATLNEQELNQWSSASDGPRRKELTLEYGEAKVEPGIPLFRIVEGQVQIGMPVEIKGMGGNRRIILQASGGFAAGDDGSMRFAPEAVYVGSCRIPNFQGISGHAFGGLLSLIDAPAEVRAAWPTLSGATIEDEQIRLQRL